MNAHARPQSLDSTLAVVPSYAASRSFVRRQVFFLASLALVFAMVSGGGAEVALAQPHHPLANQWFSSHEGFATSKSKWGINHRPIQPTYDQFDPQIWNGNVERLYYVNPNHSAAVDSESHNGYPAAPRYRLPRNAPAGSIIYAFSNNSSGATPAWPYQASVGDSFKVGGTGTLTEPIYVCGDIQGTKVILTRSLEPVGSYVIARGFKIIPEFATTVGITLVGRTNPFTFDNHHLLVRECEVTKPLPLGHTASATSGISISGRYVNQSPDPNNPDEPNHPLTDAIVYRCKTYEVGNWQNSTNQDHHGISVGHNTRNVTIMNSEMWNCEGNGIQVNGDSTGPAGNNRIDGVFVYRNEAHHNQQSSFWCKRATNVKFVQNTTWSSKGFGDSDPYGAGLGCQYGPNNIFFVGNTISVAKTGIIIDGGTFPGKIEIDENVISDIEDASPEPNYPAGTTGARGWGIKYQHQALDPADPIQRVKIRSNQISQAQGGVAQHGVVDVRADIINNSFIIDTALYCHIRFWGAAAASNSVTTPNSVLPAGPLVVCNP